MRDILETVEQWLGQNRSVALATVAATWGSSPRQAGAKMAIAPDFLMIGSVSGGCVESAVLNEGLEVLGSKTPRLLNYGVSDDSAWEVGLACGGKVSVYVEPLDRGWWAAVTHVLEQSHVALTITVIEGPQAGSKLLLDAVDGVIYQTIGLDSEPAAALKQAAEAAILTAHQTSRATVAGLDVLIDVHRPSPRLVIIGGAHVSQALCQLAQVLGYSVVVIDPRSAFSTPERFPAIQMISHLYPDKVLPELNIDSETYIAVLTHDPKIDDPALRVALTSDAAYIGVMSSKRSHTLRIERLIKAGIDPALIERIRTPIGLNLGAQMPEEIALSIMAEIVAVRHHRELQPVPEVVK